MYSVIKKCLVLVALMATPVSGQQMEQDSVGPHDEPVADTGLPNSADRILDSLSDSQVRQLVAEALDRNPGLAATTARARHELEANTAV